MMDGTGTACNTTLLSSSWFRHACHEHGLLVRWNILHDATVPAAGVGVLVLADTGRQPCSCHALAEQNLHSMQHQSQKSSSRPMLASADQQNIERRAIGTIKAGNKHAGLAPVNLAPERVFVQQSVNCEESCSLLFSGTWLARPQPVPSHRQGTDSREQHPLLGPICPPAQNNCSNTSADKPSGSKYKQTCSPHGVTT